MKSGDGEPDVRDDERTQVTLTCMCSIHYSEIISVTCRSLSSSDPKYRSAKRFRDLRRIPPTSKQTETEVDVVSTPWDLSSGGSQNIGSPLY